MDNGGTVRSVQDNQLEQVRCPVWSQDEASLGVLADLVDGESLEERVPDVLRVDAVT